MGLNWLFNHREHDCKSGTIDIFSHVKDEIGKKKNATMTISELLCVIVM